MKKLSPLRYFYSYEELCQHLNSKRWFPGTIAKVISPGRGIYDITLKFADDIPSTGIREILSINGCYSINYIDDIRICFEVAK